MSETLADEKPAVVVTKGTDQDAAPVFATEERVLGIPKSRWPGILAPLVTGALFAIQGGVYHWLPKWTGHLYDMRLAKWHFWLSAIFVNVLFFPQHFLGLAGMPRRIPDYATQFTDWNMVSSIGGFVYGASQLLFAYVIWKCVRTGTRVPGRVWEGARGLEWVLTSPPPHHSWEHPPPNAVVARETL